MSTEPPASTYPTPLQKYMVENGIPFAWVERQIHISRQQFARWRLARTDPQRKKMVQILGAIRRYPGHENVRIDQLFDLNPDNTDNWR